MADDESSDLSSLSSLSPAPSEDEGDVQLKSDKKGILKFFHKAPKGKAAKQSAAQKEASPPAPKRPQSPPHDYVLADNPDIAVSSLCPRRATGEKKNAIRRVLTRINSPTSSLSCSAADSAMPYPNPSPISGPKSSSAK